MVVPTLIAGVSSIVEMSVILVSVVVVLVITLVPEVSVVVVPVPTEDRVFVVGESVSVPSLVTILLLTATSWKQGRYRYLSPKYHQ